MTTPATPPPPPPPDSDPADSVPAPQPAPGGGSRGPSRGLLGNKKFLGIAGGTVIAIVAVVAVVLFARGGGRTFPQDFILNRASSVAIVDVAAILASPEIPSQLASFSSLGLPGINPDDPEDWKDRWRNKWADDFSKVSGAIGLDDITVAALQTDADGKALGWVFTGQFVFADIRDSLEDAGSDSDTYLSFEIWDDEIALLEDDGVLVVGAFARDLLKALDTDRGIADDSSALRQALDRSEGLIINGVSGCNSNFFQASLNSCDALAEVVSGGDAATSQVTGVYVFVSENQAESGLDDIEVAIGEQNTYDTILDQIETDSQLVTYEASIIGPFIGGGTGEGDNPQDLILEDAPFVTVQNVAAILQTEFPDGIPQQIMRFRIFTVPSSRSSDLEDAEEWKQDWADVYADTMPYWMGEAIALEEVNYAMQQGFGGGDLVGTIFSGNFDFEDIRETLRDDEDGPGLKDGEYRGFEVWGDDNEIALLEDRGLIVYSAGFVQEFLKALDRGGFVDDDSALKRALDKTGDVLVLRGNASCNSSYYFDVSGINRCEANVDAVEGGDVFESTISGVYVFRSENSAERGRDDIEDAIEEQDRYDADPEKVENSGEFVTFQATIHQDYEFEPPTMPTTTIAPTSRGTREPGPFPTQAPPQEDKYQVAVEFVQCAVRNGLPWVLDLTRQYGTYNAAQVVGDENSLNDLLDARRRECGY